MKRIFLFLATISLLVACSGGESNTETSTNTAPNPKAPERQGWDWDANYPLYGDVEEVTISEYKLLEKFGEEVKGDLKDRYIYKFNERGDVIEKARYNSDGSLKWKDTYKYDSKGNQIECNSYRGEIMIPEGLDEYIIVYRK